MARKQYQPQLKVTVSFSGEEDAKQDNLYEVVKYICDQSLTPINNEKK
jgi:hypothetical protein